MDAATCHPPLLGKYWTPTYTHKCTHSQGRKSWIGGKAEDCWFRLHDHQTVYLWGNIGFHVFSRGPCSLCTVYVMMTTVLSENLSKLPAIVQAENETPPVVVRLGLLASPGWWLTRLRQAVCTRAHWLLQGSVIYATPATTSTTERPSQVFISLLSLYPWTQKELELVYSKQQQLQ